MGVHGAQLLELQELDDLALIIGQRGNRAADVPGQRVTLLHRRPHRFRRALRIELAQQPAPLHAQGIDEAVLDDGVEPRHEGPRRVVGMASAVQRHQRLLHDIVAPGDVAQSASDKRLRQGRNAIQQLFVRLPVAVLGLDHQPPEFVFLLARHGR